MHKMAKISILFSILGVIYAQPYTVDIMLAIGQEVGRTTRLALQDRLQ